MNLTNRLFLTRCDRKSTVRASTHSFVFSRTRSVEKKGQTTKKGKPFGGTTFGGTRFGGTKCSPMYPAIDKCIGFLCIFMFPPAFLYVILCFQCNLVNLRDVDQKILSMQFERFLLVRLDSHRRSTRYSTDPIYNLVIFRFWIHRLEFQLSALMTSKTQIKQTADSWINFFGSSSCTK